MIPPDYIVLRADPKYRNLPERMEGLWLNANNIPAEGLADRGVPQHAKVTPTGNFEVRADGAVAEVWVVSASDE